MGTVLAATVPGSSDIRLTSIATKACLLAFTPANNSRTRRGEFPGERGQDLLAAGWRHTPGLLPSIGDAAAADVARLRRRRHGVVNAPRATGRRKSRSYRLSGSRRDRGHAMGHLAGRTCIDREHGRGGFLFLPAHFQFPGRRPTRCDKPPVVSRGRAGQQPSRLPLAARDRETASARTRNSKPLRLFAAAGGVLYRFRSDLRNRELPVKDARPADRLLCSKDRRSFRAAKIRIGSEGGAGRRLFNNRGNRHTTAKFAR